MRDRPSDLGLPAYGETSGDAAHRPSAAGLLSLLSSPFAALQDAARTPLFWILFGTFFICGCSTSGLIQTHFITLCADYGVAAVAAASVLAMMGVFDFIGTIGSGWLSDRFDNRWLLFWYYGLRGLSLLYLPFTTFTFYGLSLFAMFYGLDWIATVPPTVKLTADRFGRERAPHHLRLDFCRPSGWRRGRGTRRRPLAHGVLQLSARVLCCRRALLHRCSAGADHRQAVVLRLRCGRAVARAGAGLISPPRQFRSASIWSKQCRQAEGGRDGVAGRAENSSARPAGGGRHSLLGLGRGVTPRRPRHPIDTIWTVPEVGALPDDDYGRLVRRGRDLITATYAHIGPQVADPAKRFAGNNLACSDCHLEAGTKKFGLPVFGLYGDFPHYSARAGAEISVEDRVNACMTRSLNGRALPADTPEMRAFVAYIKIPVDRRAAGAAAAGTGRRKNSRA